MSNSLHKLLKFLYFEGYADSYKESELLLSEMTEEEIDEISYLSRLPKGTLDEVSDLFMRMGAQHSMEKESQRRQEKSEKLKQLATQARQRKQRTGDTIIIPGSSGGKKGNIVYNKTTGQRTFIPDKK